MHGKIQRDSLIREIRERIDYFPALALLGARQVGKTTLARDFASQFEGEVVFYDLERPADREALSADPHRILSEQTGLVVLDEVQRLPELFALLRPILDEPKRTARFLLLGSASWDLIRGVSETLAGRMTFLDISGFSLGTTGPDSQSDLWLKGGFPKAFLAPDMKLWQLWMESFTRTFLERDLPGIGSKIGPEALGRFWRMLAHFHGQTWNAKELAKSMDVSHPTVTRYRDLLAGTFMIRVLPPWLENLGKRLVKSPKVYLRDSGILHHLLGIQSHHQLHTHPRYGASWEGFALEQVLLTFGDRNAYFYATQNGAELDLFLLHEGQRIGFEFKCTDAPKTTKSMHTTFGDLKLDHLFVVYPGRKKFPMNKDMTALPLIDLPNLEISGKR